HRGLRRLRQLGLAHAPVERLGHVAEAPDLSAHGQVVVEITPCALVKANGGSERRAATQRAAVLQVGDQRTVARLELPIAAPDSEPAALVTREELLRRRGEIAIVVPGIQPVGERELPEIA